MLVSQLSFPGIGRRKRRTRGESLIAIVIVGTPVQLVRSRFDDQVDGATRVAPGFRASLRLQREFLPLSPVAQGPRDTLNSPLINGHDIPPLIVVITPFDLPVDLICPSAIHGSVGAGRVPGEAR